MKYHNLKRIFAGFMAAALTLGTTAFVASAEDTTDVTYYLNGYKDGNDYVLSITAQGGLINIGALEIDYNTDAFEDVVLTFADNIKDARFYMGYDDDEDAVRDGKAEIAFMSAAGLGDDDADLFATNPSTTIAYIDATGNEPVDIATLRFTFGYGYSYDTLFVRGEAEGSEESAEVKVAKAILHSADGYAVDEVAATAEISNMLVFTADDFTLGNLETVYNGKGQTYTVDSDVATSWDICVGDNADSTVTDAGEYRVFLKDVKGEGYYDAIEVEFTEKFVIKKADKEITAPANPEAVKYVAGGFNLEELEIDDWTVTSEGKVAVGTHTVNVKYEGEFDTDNYNYTFEGEAITSAPETTVTLTVNPAEGDVPSIEEPDAVTYNPDVAQTVAGYGIELDKDWEFVDENTSLVIGENKDIAIKFVPDDIVNYTYEGFDAELGYVPGKVTVTLNKAKGTGPESPKLVKEYRLKAEQIGKEIPVSEFGDFGVWETVVESLPGKTGTEWFTLTYTPKDLDKYDYSEEPRWVASANRFEYQYFVTILPAYLPSGLVPPANPEAKTFTEDGFKYSDFALTEGWTYAAPDTAITTAGEHKNVKVLYDIPDDFTANPEDGYTVEDGKIVSYVTITVNKIALPADAAIATAKTAQYTGSPITVDVVTNEAYTGLGTFTVAYPYGNIVVGKYTATATFAEGDNYLGGTVTFNNILVIEKAVLQAMDVPVIAEEMYVDTKLSGAADDNGWQYDKEYTIAKGTNTVTVYKTIGAQTAMNWDFSKAAADKGATVTELADGSVMLAKVYTITGKVKTGKFTISAATVRAVEGESDVDDIIVTITPENGEAFILDSSYITEVDDVITISDVELEVGIYTITVKKMKYLTEYYETLVVASMEDEISMVLTAGDIVGGEAGKETMGDGVIDIDDFVIAIRAFDTSASAEVKAAADIDEDGSNNVTDLGFIKANFNKTAK